MYILVACYKNSCATTIAGNKNMILFNKSLNLLYKYSLAQKNTVMKILLDINDNKASFFMEVLKNFSFVNKATPISVAKAELMEDIKEAVEEMKLIKEGKLEARNAEDLINEL